jgi:DNA repair protein SbcD/Mre11
MKFVHAADLHLDSPMRGLTAYEGAPVDALLGSTRGACRNLIDLCNREQADLLLLAGDLFDGPWRDHKTALFFAGELARLVRTRVFIVRGNHDAESKLTLRLPAFVTTFRVDSAETYVIEDLGIAIHGQSFRQRSVKQDLAKSYPKAVAHMFNIGMLHTSLDGREHHADYAPTNLATLLARGYDYWALGHVHEREVVHASPPIIYPGNLQGRHVKELGPKGATLVTVHPHSPPQLHAHELDTVRWFHEQISLDGIATTEQLEDALYSYLRSLVGAEPDTGRAGGRIAAVRVTLTGAGPLANEITTKRLDWLNSLRAMATEIGSGRIYVEALKLAWRHAPAAAKQSGSHEASIADALRARPLEDDVALLQELLGQLPPDVRAAALDLEQAEQQLAFIAEQRMRLLGDLEAAAVSGR